MVRKFLIYSIKSANLAAKNLLRKDFDLKGVKKIIVILPQGLGDVLISTPAIRALKKRFKNARVDILAYPWSSFVLNGNPDVGKIIERKGAWFFKILREKYDLAVNFELFMDNLISFFAGAKYRIGYAIEDNDLLLHKAAPYIKDRHVITYALDVVNLIGAKSDARMDIFIPSSAEKKIKQLIKKEKMRKIIAIAPGGGNNPYKKSPGKVWSWKKYVEVIDNMDHDSTFVILGDKNDSEIAGKIIKNVKNLKIYDFTGKMGIFESAALIKNSKLFIGNDSFLMHVASALDTPLISLFGPTNPKRLAPLNKKAIYIKKGENIEDINPSDVLKTVKSLKSR